MKIFFSLLCAILYHLMLPINAYAALDDCTYDEHIFLIEDNYITAKKTIFDNCVQKKYITKDQQTISGYNDNYGLKYSNYKIYKMINALTKVKSDLDITCMNNSCKGIIDIGFTNNNIKHLLLVNYIRDLLNIELVAVTNQQKLKYKSHIIHKNNDKYLLIESDIGGFIAVNNNDHPLEISYDKLGVSQELMSILSYKNIDLWSAYRKIYSLIYSQVGHLLFKNMQNQHVYLSGDVCNNFFNIPNFFAQDKSTNKISVMNLMTRLNKLSYSDISNYFSLKSDDAKFLVQEVILLYVIMKLFNIQKAQCISPDITLDGYIEGS